jgi:hypothetical protein
MFGRMQRAFGMPTVESVQRVGSTRRKRAPDPHGSLWDLVWVIPLVTAAAGAIIGVAWVVAAALPSIQMAGGVAYAVATTGGVQGLPISAPSPSAVSFAIWGLGAGGTAGAAAIVISVFLRASRDPGRFTIPLLGVAAAVVVYFCASVYDGSKLTWGVLAVVVGFFVVIASALDTVESVAARRLGIVLHVVPIVVVLLGFSSTSPEPFVRAVRQIDARGWIAVGFLVALSIVTVLGARRLERATPSEIP